jgi:arylsulfatase A-like enzyme
MELEEQTIAEILKPAGYTSCHIGKWHLGTVDWYPEKQGFDYNIGGCDFGQPPTYFDPYYNNKYGAGDIPTLKPRKMGDYLTDREADEACSFIKAHRDKPFFLHMAHYAVHTPIEGKRDLVDKYKTKRSISKQNNPTYAAMVESVDQAVGQVMKTLKNLNLRNNTMIIFTSDNGGLKHPCCTDNSPLRSGKGYPYEGGIRIPQIIYWPGMVSAGSVCETPVSSIDFLPTICEVTHQPLPKNCVIDGQSLIPLLTGKGCLNRESLFWHFPHYRSTDVVPYSIIRSGDWKLIKRYEGKTYELFNLKEDLSETTDLSQLRRNKVSELEDRLNTWLNECRAKLPKVNPRYGRQD